MNILLTGGLGFIGSHVAVVLLGAGHRVVLLDDLSNSHESTKARVEHAAGSSAAFHPVDIRDGRGLDALFSRHTFDAVIHLAARKSVPESFSDPLGYYSVNVSGTLSLLEAMERFGVRRLIYSSSAAVYGEVDTLSCVDESVPPRPMSPYATSKAVCEHLIGAFVGARPDWRAIVLRYFNPAGAHPSGLLGEDSKQQEPHLVRACLRAALHPRRTLQVYGTDYPTPDGSAVRDIVHVMDIAQGHVAALAALDRLPAQTMEVFNLGSGKGSSVLDVAAAMGRAAATVFRIEPAGRRPGDIPFSVADVRKARAVLGWSAQHTLDEVCVDALRWERSRQ